MKKSVIAILFGTLFVLLAPAQAQSPKVALKSYFGKVDTSSANMKTIANEMQVSMKGLKEKIASGDFDPEAIKVTLNGFEERMTKERSGLEALKPPAEAQNHQSLVLDQYATAIMVLRKTGPMLDIAKQMADLAATIKGAEDEEAAKKSILPKMQTLQNGIVGIQKEVVALAKQGQEFDKQAKAERTALTEKYGLES